MEHSADDVLSDDLFEGELNVDNGQTERKTVKIKNTESTCGQ